MADALVTSPALFRFPSQRDILAALFRRWILIVLCTLAAALWAIDGLHSAVISYAVQMQVTPAQQEGDTTRIPGGLAGLVNLALPSIQGGSDFRLYLDSLTSRNIADELANNPNFMHEIFSSQWDPVSQTWHEPKDTGLGAFRKRAQHWLGFPASEWHPPNGEDLVGFLNYTVKVIQDPRRPYIATVTMTYPDPQFAVTFLAELHRAADNELRQKALKRTTDYIAFLSDTLGKVTVAEHRAALAEALSEQERAAMIARSGSPFAADLFERPWASSYPVEPRPMRTLMTAGLIGALIGSALALLHWSAVSFYRRRSQRHARKAITSGGAAFG